MTVTTLNSSTSVAANGSNRTFQFDFALLDESHLYVYTIDTDGVHTLQSEYSVDDFGDEGGSITFTLEATPTNGHTVYMQRNVPVTQETDYLPNDPFPAEVHEDALDKLTMIVQDSNYNLDRCITVPVEDTATDLELPLAPGRADRYLYFDENGNVSVASSTLSSGTYYTADEVDALFEDYYDKSEIDAMFAALTDYYNVVGDWNKQQYFGAATLTDGATINWNLDDGQTAKVTLGGNRTMAAPTNMEDGGTYILRVIQDGSGSRTITWNAVFKWTDDTAPTLSTNGGDIDVLSFYSDGTNMYGGVFYQEATS